jgi:hypothetical protein
MVRRCPVCQHDSIVGHGRRGKQAHDESHDWIRVRRGICNECGTTFTLLPFFSLPYTHYSLLARGQALHRRFVEGRCWESAAPTVQDPNRVADPSTLRRWFHHLQDAAPPMPSLRRTLAVLSQRLSGAEMVSPRACQSTWRTLVPFLQQLWPLRL